MTGIVIARRGTMQSAPVAAGYAAAVAADNPVSWWRLGEATPGTGQATDAQAANHGTYVASPASVAGAISDGNTAVSLNGSTQWITVPDSASLDVGDVFTLEIWAKWGSGAGGDLFRKGDDGFRLVDVSFGDLRFDKAGAAIITTSSAPYGTGAWHHIVLTKNGATVHIYIDGVDRTGAVTDATISNTASPLLIGNGDTAYSGSLDEAAIYATALSAGRVLAHFEAA